MPKNKKKEKRFVYIDPNWDQYQKAQKLYEIVCNNSVYPGADCYGESFCNYNNKGKKCNHKDVKCPKCELDVCGCCYALLWFDKCPSCEKSIEDFCHVCFDNTFSQLICKACERVIGNNCGCLALTWCQSNYGVCRECIGEYDPIECDTEDCSGTLNSMLADNSELCIVEDSGIEKLCMDCL